MTASWCDPHSVLRCHELSQNYISLCLGAVAQLGLGAWTCGSPRAPLDSVAQSGGINNHRSQWSAGQRDPLLLPAWCHPQVPQDAVLSGHRKTTPPQESWAVGEVMGIQGHRRALGTVAQKSTVARKLFLKILFQKNTSSPVHNYHVRLLLLQPASLSCGP